VVHIITKIICKQVQTTKIYTQTHTHKHNTHFTTSLQENLVNSVHKCQTTVDVIVARDYQGGSRDN